MNSINLHTDSKPLNFKQLKLATNWFDALPASAAKKLLKVHNIQTYRDLIIVWTKEVGLK